MTTTALPAWQHGFPLAQLRALAAPFKATAGAHVYGAFGLPKERDVAAALAEGRLAWTAAPEGEVPAAVALCRLQRQASQQQDFRGAAIPLPAGDLACAALGLRSAEAADVAEGARLLETLWQRSAAPALWVELFEEAPAHRALAAAAGLEWLATKISAGSEVKGVYLRARAPEVAAARRASLRPLAPADRPSLGCLAPAFLSEAERAALLAELRAYEAREPWQQHYSSYNKRQSWTAFALHGYDAADPGFIIKPAEMAREWKAQHPARLAARAAPTAAAAHFPQTLALLAERLGASRYDRLRFMRLSGSGELSRHADITDRSAGTQPGAVCRLHVPLQSTPACVVQSWGLRGEARSLWFAPGGLYYLDQRKPHAVRNGDPQRERLHLVADVYATPPLAARLAELEP